MNVVRPAMISVFTEVPFAFNLKIFSTIARLSINSFDCSAKLLFEPSFQWLVQAAEEGYAPPFRPTRVAEVRTVTFRVDCSRWLARLQLSTTGIINIRVIKVRFATGSGLELEERIGVGAHVRC